jgi:hypothetical protein
VPLQPSTPHARGTRRNLSFECPQPIRGIERLRLPLTEGRRLQERFCTWSTGRSTPRPLQAATDNDSAGTQHSRRRYADEEHESAHQGASTPSSTYRGPRQRASPVNSAPVYELGAESRKFGTPTVCRFSRFRKLAIATVFWKFSELHSGSVFQVSWTGGRCARFRELTCKPAGPPDGRANEKALTALSRISDQLP